MVIKHTEQATVKQQEITVSQPDGLFEIKSSEALMHQHHILTDL
jgi:hypothetical protein